MHLGPAQGKGKTCGAHWHGQCARGHSFDLTEVDPDDGNPWDLSVKEKRDKAMMIIRTVKPALVIGSCIENVKEEMLARSTQNK